MSSTNGIYVNWSKRGMALALLSKGKIRTQPVYTLLALEQPKLKSPFNFQGHGFFILQRHLPDNWKFFYFLKPIFFFRSPLIYIRIKLEAQSQFCASCIQQLIWHYGRKFISLGREHILESNFFQGSTILS